MKLVRLSTNRIVNLDAIAHAQWHQKTLWVNFLGQPDENGIAFKGEESHELWQILKNHAEAPPEAQNNTSRLNRSSLF